MKAALNKIMLVDDNSDDNFFHEREIKKILPSTVVISKNSAIEALDYLKSMKVEKEIPPVLIFLDINMPLMDGWEFLEEYQQLDRNLQSKITIIMLSTSDNPFDMAKAKTFNIVNDYIIKPLTKEIMEDITRKYFYFDEAAEVWVLKPRI
jgi:PleD family two-component response regulator